MTSFFEFLQTLRRETSKASRRRAVSPSERSDPVGISKQIVHLLGTRVSSNHGRSSFLSKAPKTIPSGFASQVVSTFSRYGSVASKRQNQAQKCRSKPGVCLPLPNIHKVSRVKEGVSVPSSSEFGWTG